ncbi:MAG: tRNA (adenosine(37)-N6)-dimethylallyltransferase MiaA [Clostridiales bacterium]|nr:tRNA (adenosine(37)-N6)-dimethylallyltransferase MiaA [Clostridiales bacterium]
MVDVIIIYGPTAVGKSAIAVQLAKAINGEIISADSKQIYKKLDIGSAKVTKEEMDGIKHYLIDIKQPWEDYSVSDFCIDANKAIKNILSRNKTPIIVGGTGLYIKGLIEGYSFGNTAKDIDFRSKLQNYTNSEIYQQILSINPNEIIDKENRHRLIRRLECLTLGTQNINNDFKYTYKLFVISDERQKIYDRINNRVDKMLKDGLLDEAKMLQSECTFKDCLAMKAIGYKELFPFLNNEKSLEECTEILKQKSRNYAKRQFTFLNQFKSYTKVDFIGVKETTIKIKQILEEQNG